MKGRKPKLSVIAGGRVPGKCPAAPHWLDEHAQAEWRRVAPELHSRGLLTPEATATLEAYCVAAGTVRELEDLMRSEGRIVTIDGAPKTHPAFRMQTTAMREARLLVCELALTPHRRGDKGGGKEGKGDGWDADLLA